MKNMFKAELRLKILNIPLCLISTKELLAV
jgi:hypothetical protein